MTGMWAWAWAWAAGLLSAAVLVWPTAQARPRRAGPGAEPAPCRPGGCSHSGAPDPGAVRDGGSLRPFGWWTAAGRGRAGAPSGWVAEFAELAAVGLDAGLGPAQAARLALQPAGAGGAHDGAPGLALDRALRAADEDGTGVGAAVAEAARASDRSGPSMTFLGHAWSLTDDLGAPAGAATRAAARVLREREAADARRRVVLAGPRASMWLLSLLPAAGPVVGVALGIAPDELYGNVPALTSAGAGLALTLAGWWWAHAILDRAGRPRGLGP